MKQRIPSVIVCLYLLGCIVFGGSAQSPWTNLALQLFGICLIAWAGISGSSPQEGRRTIAINLLLICALLWVLIQLIPLPSGIWTRLPGRAPLADGLVLLGYPVGPFPISEMPYASVFTLFAAIPAIAAFLATERLAPSPRYIAAAIVAGMIFAIFLGALQVAGGPSSPAYLYEIHSSGAIGFFANGNHMATLLLVGIPMTAALLVSIQPRQQTSMVVRYLLGLAALVLIVIGIALNGSRAAIGLSIPLIIASAALLPAANRWRGTALALSAVVLIAGIAVIVSNPIASAELDPDAASIGSRGKVWSTTTEAIATNLPVGTGLGTFQAVYHRYEDPAGVTRSYINHAHNEYLEIALELGAPGMLLMALFLAWWAIIAIKVWTTTYGSPFARAATVATAAILAHSFVDFPLRTGAISAIFAACVGLMSQHFRPVAAARPGELHATRHVKLG